MKKSWGRLVVGLGLALGLVCYGGLGSVTLAQADTINVPLEYSTIQSAIDAALPGDTVLVDDGIYTENINFNGLAITVQSVNGAEHTTIDGNASGSVVTFASGEGADSVLDGFTVTNGSYYQGGGISCLNSSSPTIKNCNIIGNTAPVTTPTANGGGGIYCGGSSSPFISNCLINSNSATGENAYGGGVFCSSSSPDITDCIIRNNTIENASSGGRGGGIWCFKSSPTITNCTISYNTAYNSGGGMAVDNNSSPDITNCNIVQNISQGGYGGGIYCTNNCKLTINNCTISDNSNALGGGAFYIDWYCTLTVVNSIFWGNKVGIIPDEIYIHSLSSITFSHSDIDPLLITGSGSVSWLTGNISEPPQFVGDYHLTSVSPCIDAGTLTGSPEYDFEGDPRLASVGGDDMPDMGADEFGCTNVALVVDTQVPPDGEYRNHGDYVSQTAQIVDSYLEAGLITEECASDIMHPIAQSDVGKQNKGKGKGK